jgi:hypothetical protein
MNALHCIAYLLVVSMVDHEVEGRGLRRLAEPRILLLTVDRSMECERKEDVIASVCSALLSGTVSPIDLRKMPPGSGVTQCLL